MSHQVSLSIEACNVLADLQVSLRDRQHELEAQHEDLNDQLQALREHRSVVCHILDEVVEDGFLLVE